MSNEESKCLAGILLAKRAIAIANADITHYRNRLKKLKEARNGDG